MIAGAVVELVRVSMSAGELAAIVAGAFVAGAVVGAVLRGRR